jgi:hypothetical protein
MAIDFPASPTLNDVFTVGNVTYVWDGTKWTASVTGGISLDKIEEGNTSAEVIDTGSDGRFVVTTEGTERLRVTNTGRVGIGTTTAGANLDLAGTTSRILWDVNNAYTLQTHGNTAFSAFASSIQNAADYQFQIAGSERVRIDSSGRLGIGTSSPGDALTVQGTGNSYIGLQSATSGYASLKQIVTDTSAWLRTETSHPLYLGTNQTRAITIDTSQRVGIGTATVNRELVLYKASAPAFHIQNSTSGTGVFDGFAFSSIGADATIWNYENGYLRFGTNDTERARIDSSGRLLVGASTARANLFNATISAGLQLEAAGALGAPNRFLSVINNFATAGDGGGVIALGRSKGGTVGSNTVVAANDQLGRFDFQGNDGTQFVSGAMIEAYVDGTSGADDMPGRLVFSTTADGASSPTERMRISNDGRVSINTAAKNYQVDIRSDGNLSALGLTQTSNSFAQNAFFIDVNRTTTDGSYNFLRCIQVGATDKLFIRDSGNVVNANNSYGAISDARLKENIVDATSQWNDVKTLQVRKYNFKEETGQPTHTQIGLVAQEVELVSPGLVTESPDRDSEGNDLGTTTKSVNYSVLYMKAVKALQEAMERIETLEGMVAVNNITIDEQQHQLSTLAARLTALESP